MSDTIQQADPLPPAAEPTPGLAGRAWRSARVRYALFGVAGIVLVALSLAWLGGYSYVPAADVASAVTKDLPSKNDLKQLEKKMAALQPRGVYIVVDASQNGLRLMKNDKVLREAVVSAGTGAVLKDEKSGRTWVFETPRGVRIVRTKKTNPCWARRFPRSPSPGESSRDSSSWYGRYGRRVASRRPRSCRSFHP